MYDLASGSRSTMESSTLLQEGYPQMFVRPNGTLFFAGPSKTRFSWNVDPAGGPWIKTPNAFIATLFGSAVMYEPGKVMRAGAVDGTPLHGTTQTIDLNLASPQWVDGANEMLPRAYHNMVLLPDGQVMVLGGKNGGGSVKEPQIWNPVTREWIPGPLASDPVKREHHSTSILLPDGRILTAGSDNIVSASLYCPPYLFKPNSNESAVRPQILAAPSSTTVGGDFYLCVDNATTIQRVALIRPGFTTHGFDQSQAYVRLDHTVRGPGLLHVRVPDNPNIALPGSHMLFVVGSADRPDVPSIARWLKIESPSADPCDNVPGAAVSPQIDAEGTTSLHIYWNETTDDHSDLLSGPPFQAYEVKRKLTPIDSEANYASATTATISPSPVMPTSVGAYKYCAILGLSQCTTYHLAVRSRDDNGNLGQLHGEVTGTTIGTIGCGNLVARPDASLSSLRGRGAGSPTGADESARVSGALVVETRRTSTGGWRVVVRQKDDSSALTGVSADREVEVQDAAGDSWSTRRAFDAAAEEQMLGLCRISEGGRTVLRGFTLADVAARFKTREGTFARDAGSGPDAGLSLADGDSLVLDFEPVAPDPSAPAGNWYVLVTRANGALSRALVPDAIESPAMPPITFGLRQNEPNPFAGMTKIAFDLPVRSETRLEIFDLLGRRIRTLASGSRDPGRYSVEWDRRDESGVPVRPGVYLYTLVAGEFRAKRAMVLLK